MKLIKVFCGFQYCKLVEVEVLTRLLNFVASEGKYVMFSGDSINMSQPKGRENMCTPIYLKNGSSREMYLIKQIRRCCT